MEKNEKHRETLILYSQRNIMDIFIIEHDSK